MANLIPTDMKNNIIPIIIAAVAALGLASCASAPSMQPAVDLETTERQMPVTGTPNIGQHEAARNAVDYGIDRRYYHGGGGLFGF